MDPFADEIGKSSDGARPSRSHSVQTVIDTAHGSSPRSPSASHPFEEENEQLRAEIQKLQDAYRSDEQEIHTLRELVEKHQADVEKHKKDNANLRKAHKQEADGYREDMADLRGDLMRTKKRLLSSTEKFATQEIELTDLRASLDEEKQKRQSIVKLLDDYKRDYENEILGLKSQLAAAEKHISTNAKERQLDFTTMKRMMTNYGEARKKRDAKAISSLFVEDGVYKQSPRCVVRGRKNIESHWSCRHRLKRQECMQSFQAIVSDFVLDMSTGEGVAKWEVRTSEKPEHFCQLARILFRMEDGTWKIAEFEEYAQEFRAPQDRQAWLGDEVVHPATQSSQHENVDLPAAPRNPFKVAKNDVDHFGQFFASATVSSARTQDGRFDERKQVRSKQIIKRSVKIGDMYTNRACSSMRVRSRSPMRSPARKAYSTQRKRSPELNGARARKRLA